MKEQKYQEKCQSNTVELSFRTFKKNNLINGLTFNCVCQNFLFGRPWYNMTNQNSVMQQNRHIRVILKYIKI